MSREFKARPSHLLPEIFAVSLAGILTYALRISNAPIEVITIFPETTGGITLNAEHLCHTHGGNWNADVSLRKIWFEARCEISDKSGDVGITILPV